jgi:protein O-mannosyl-transferase
MASASRKARRREKAARSEGAGPSASGPGPARPDRPSPPEGRPGLLRAAAPWAVLALLLAGTALAYQPAVHGGFHFDDWGSIQANMHLRAPDATALPALASLLGPSRAVTELTFAHDYRAVGLDPLRYHVVNLLLHLVASVLAFVYARGLLLRVGHPRAVPVAVVVAGVFALHPIQTQAVAYLAQRAEVLASLFYLACLVLLDAAASRGWTLRGLTAWAGGLVTWVLGMGAKTIAITAPAAFLLDQAVLGREAGPTAPNLARRAGRALVLAAPLLLLAAWSVTIHLGTFAATPQAGVGFQATATAPWQYFLTQWRVQWLYLRLLAWPDGLALDRTFEASQALDGRTALAGAGILLVLGLAVWLWRRAERARGDVPAERVAAFGILFWFLVLLPTSSVMPVLDLAVEHRVYLASLGPILAVVVGAEALLRRFLPGPAATRAGAALAAAALLALGVGLLGRARVWSSEETLWADAAEKVTDNARIFTNLGLALQGKGDLAGAEAAYRRGLPLARHPLHIVMLARNYGGLLENLGRFPEALAILERALEVSPDHAELRANRAVALVQMGRHEEALVDAKAAVEKAPGNPILLNVLGEIQAYLAHWAEALPQFQAATAIDPASPLYFTNQALALAGLGRTKEACGVLAEARARYGPEGIPKTASRWIALIDCPR